MEVRLRSSNKNAILQSQICVSVRLLADDTDMIMSDNSLEKLNNAANNEAKIIDEWLTSNKLTLNTSKTSFMLFSPKKMSIDKFSLNIRGERINRTHVAKYLGLQYLLMKSLSLMPILSMFAKNCHKFVVYFVIFDTTSVRKHF